MSNIVPLVQTAFYVASPLVTLLAVLVAYIALAKQSRPQILIQYSPNPDIPSFINLVIENIGSGMARDIRFSQPLPAGYYGIEESDGSGADILSDGLPALAASQMFIFDGGQYGGLTSRLGSKLEIEVSYRYVNPIGIRRNKKDVCVLSTDHLAAMPTRMSANQAIVDALKSHNQTTLHRIENELKKVAAAINSVVVSKYGSDGR